MGLSKIHFNPENGLLFAPFICAARRGKAAQRFGRGVSYTTMTLAGGRERDLESTSAGEPGATCPSARPGADQRKDCNRL